jgi:hypothetical protein
MGIRLYLCFWRECAREAWRGSWGIASGVSVFLGGAIIFVVAWLLGLKKDAPSSIEGTIGFGLAVAVASLIAGWAVIFAIRLLGAPVRFDSRKLGMSDLEHLLPGRFVFNEFVYGGDFGLMCLDLTGRFDIEQLRDTFTEVKVPAPINSSARIKISFMNGRQNVESKCYFYILDRSGNPRSVEDIYQEQRIKLDSRSCFQLKLVHEDSYVIHDQASLRITISSWSR